MKFLILAGGEATRWGDFLGTPKHLAPLCGERLLDRTVRLLQERGQTDIRIIVSDMSDERYKVSGARRVLRKDGFDRFDVDKFRSSMHLWDEGGVTVLPGDIFYTEEALDTILGDEDDYRFFCRFGESTVTKKPYGEPFATRIMPASYERMFQVMDDLAGMHEVGEIERSGMWEIYRMFMGGDIHEHTDLGGATIIDDWTDDFDFPVDWERWCLAWAQTDPAFRPPIYEG